MLVLALLFAFPAAGSSWHGTDLPPAVVPPDLWVQSYNLNFGLQGDPETLAAVGAGAPDIVLLQETTPGWERALRAEYAVAYDTIAFIDGPGAGGMGLLSRWPVLRDEVLISPVGWFPAWRMVLDTPWGPLQVLALHLKPPYAERGGFVVGAFTTGDDRRAELDVYLSFLEPGLPTVVLGDFNEQRGASLALLEDQGFVDAVPAGVDTWRWTVAGFDLSAALDHVFVGPGLLPVQVEVADRGRSDHLPVLVGLVRE